MGNCYECSNGLPFSSGPLEQALSAGPQPPTLGLTPFPHSQQRGEGDCRNIVRVQPHGGFRFF